MAAIGIKAAPAPAAFGNGVVVLLAVAIFINYVDRGNLATAAPLMKDELHLSASQLGLMLSAFFVLIALRLLLGLGESVAFPCSSKLIAQHLPQHRLGVANGLTAMGLSLGPAFGTFVGGLLMAKVDWPSVLAPLGTFT